MNSISNSLSTPSVYKYTRRLRLKKYKFNGQDLFIKFIKDLHELFKGNIDSCDIKIENEFGTIIISTIEDLINEIKSSDSLYSLSLNIESFQTGNLIFKYYAFEDLKTSSSITLLSNSKDWITKNEELIIKSLPEKNVMNILLNPATEFLISLFISTMFLLPFIKNAESKSLFNVLNQPTIFFPFLFILGLVYFMINILHVLLVPTFVLKKKSSFYYRVKRAFKNPINTETIIISIILGTIFLILSLLLAKII